MKKFLNKYKFILINLLIIGIILTLFFLYRFNAFNRFFFSLKFGFNSIIYYIKAIFQVGHESLPFTTYDYILDINSDLVDSPIIDKVEIGLPVNLENFGKYFTKSWWCFWNMTNFKDSFRFFIDFFISLNLIVFFLLNSVVIFVTLKTYYFTEKDINIIGYTKGMNRFNKINSNILVKIKEWFLTYHEFNKSTKFYITLILIFFFFFDIISVLIDSFCYFLLFASDFNFFLIYEFAYSSIYSLASVFKFVPFFFWMIVIYLIFDKARTKKALRKLMFYDYKNRNFIEEKTGVCNIVKGAPGVGKTLLLTDLGRTTEQLFRYNLLDTMNKYSSYFPNFDLRMYEEYIKYLKINGLVNNHSQLEDKILDRKRRFLSLFTNHLVSYEELKKYLFGYDFRSNKMRYYNGLYYIDFFEFLITYGEAYFYYISDKPIIYSNYSIRFDYSVYGKDYFPLWNYDYFTIHKDNIDLLTKYSHIIDMDSLRLGKKFNPDTTILGFGVLCFTEFDKERGNQISNNKYKKDDYKPNPTNDELTKYLKLSRQIATIDYKPYFKMFTDLQRTGDLSLGNVEISECIIKIKEKQKKNTLTLFIIEPLICEFFINLVNRFINHYRATRNYYSFFYCILVNLLNPFKTYLERRSNIYGYSKLKLEVNVGDDESDITSSTYYLMNKKAYAKVYSTDTHYGFFKESLSQEKTSIDDKPSYSSLRASASEIKAQNSFLGNDLEKSFHKKIIDEDTGEINL